MEGEKRKWQCPAPDHHNRKPEVANRKWKARCHRTGSSGRWQQGHWSVPAHFRSEPEVGHR